MIQIKPFNDDRLDGFCIYCGGKPETRDHIPSKIFLDEPFPTNLPVVSCCLKCNQGFSLDEEYVACLIECVLNSTTEVKELKREKIKKILGRKESLRQKLVESFIEINGESLFKFDSDRLDNVILKLARGHAKFETSLSFFNKPITYWAKPIIIMSEREYDNFISLPKLNKLPEVGSRTLQKLLINEGAAYHYWTDVQTNNYMYSVITDLNHTIVRIIIRNYLAAEIAWRVSN